MTSRSDLDICHNRPEGHWLAAFSGVRSPLLSCQTELPRSGTSRQNDTYQQGWADSIPRFVYLVGPNKWGHIQYVLFDADDIFADARTTHLGPRLP